MTRRRVAIGLAIALLSTSCTGGDPPTAAGTRPCTPGPECPVDIVTGETEYALECHPVAEALIDVQLHDAGAHEVRAITGVSSTQAVAVLWREPQGCGLWALALAGGVSPETAAYIREEVARGVDRFGVTASPMPEEPAEG